jgi:hypothetical protein
MNTLLAILLFILALVISIGAFIVWLEYSAKKKSKS